MANANPRPDNLQALIDSGWKSKSVKQEIQDNFVQMLAAGEELYPGIIGYDFTCLLYTSPSPRDS